MKGLLHSINRLLEQGEDLVTATIINHEGSTPRHTGTRMIIRPGGDFIGTIGGGIVEAAVLRAAAELFRTGGAQVQSFELNQDNLSGMDVICGGRLSILMEHIKPSPENIELFRTAQNAGKKRNKYLLITMLDRLDGKTMQVHRCLVMDDGSTHGDAACLKTWLHTIVQEGRRIGHPVMLSIGDKHFWVEPFLEFGTLYLFGAGHVSRQTAVLGAKVGFQAVVLDDRAEFANKERFPDPIEVKVIPRFEDCVQDLEIDPDSYLVIVTRGHLSDRTVLEQALTTPAGYIGMIGSRRKRDTIFQALLQQGFSHEDLKRVHCPIGLDIDAQTPDEIAVSIVAELIRARSEKAR